MMRVVIAGGGTGGHLFPALAVAEVLHARGDEVVICISEKEIDVIASRDRDEFRFEKLPSVGMPRLFSPAIFRFARRFNESLAPCRSLYNRFKPDIVLGMGGFTSTSPILAGRLRKIPTLVHESNAIPGKANKLNAKMVNAVLLGFAECAQYFTRVSSIVTGTPIRKSLSTPLDRATARACFQLEENRQTVLVMGGSQGAHGINELLIKALPYLKELPLQFIHLTGSQDEALVLANYRREKIPAHVASFHSRMEEAYSAADFAIARSGAASLSELAHFGLPSLLIPYPHAAENHQAFNAEIFARAGAAEIMEEANITPENLTEKVRTFLRPGRLDPMMKSSKNLAPQNAAQRVVEALEKFVT